MLAVGIRTPRPQSKARSPLEPTSSDVWHWGDSCLEENFNPIPFQLSLMLLYIFLAALLTDLFPAPEDPSKKEMDAWPEGIGPGGDALTPSLSCTMVFFH